LVVVGCLALHGSIEGRRTVLFSFHRPPMTTSLQQHLYPPRDSLIVSETSQADYAAKTARSLAAGQTPCSDVAAVTLKNVDRSTIKWTRGMPLFAPKRSRSNPQSCCVFARVRHQLTNSSPACGLFRSSVVWIKSSKPCQLV